jgi:histidinol-phosphate aminotransferase
MRAAPSTASQVYTWEPSDRAIAARYGLDPTSILRFDTNTSPWPSPLVAEALAGTMDPPLNEYPDSSYQDLTEAAAAYVGARPDEIVVGAGADEVLDLVTKAFLPEGGRAIVPVPTYAMYGVLSSQRRASVVRVPRLGRDEGWALDIPATIAALQDARIVWLCAPNNPTGSPEPLATIVELLEAAERSPSRPVVVVDEAYAEFWPETAVPLRRTYPRLLVIRTVSKAFALPGVRVGYGVGPRPLIEELERVRPPGSIATPSAALAAAALRRPDWARQNAERLAAERDALAVDLAEAGWTPDPSVTNFLLVRIGSHADTDAAADRLVRRGIVPRTFPAGHPLAGHLRLTVRSREQNERLLDAVRETAT